MALRTRAAVLAAVGITLLLGAWVLSTAPFNSPDEASHYLRALSIANGTLLGPKVPYRNAAITPAQAAWAGHDTRGVFVPARLSPPNVRCLNGSHDTLAGGCIEAAYTGDYAPLPYLLPAAALSASRDATTGLWLARVASALPSLGFIILAIVFASGGGGWALVGLLAAITPMVLFVSSVVNPNGLEIAASLAFAAGLLRLARDRRPPPGWVWAAVSLSGAVVVLSWQLGPVFAAADLALALALLSREQLAALLDRHRKQVLATGLALITAVALYFVYGISSGLSHASVSFRPVRANLQQGLDQLGPAIHDAVGLFGLLMIHLPTSMYWIWWLLILALCGAAMLISERRNRIVLALTVLVAAAFPIFFYAWVYRLTGFALQGRYVLPLLALPPMLAGELLGRSGRLRGRGRGPLLAAAIAVMALLQLGAWWINARHWAGGRHALWFLGHPTWSPPLGWWPWTSMALVGTAALLGAATVQLRGEPAHSRTPKRAHW
jgi:hypothetical protein